MGTTRPTIVDFMPLVAFIERKLSTAANLLDLGSKLNSLVTSIEIYTMCYVKVPFTIVDHIDKLRRHCLWAKKDGDTTKKQTAGRVGFNMSTKE